MRQTLNDTFYITANSEDKEENSAGLDCVREITSNLFVANTTMPGNESAQSVPTGRYLQYPTVDTHGEARPIQRRSESFRASYARSHS